MSEKPLTSILKESDIEFLKRYSAILDEVIEKMKKLKEMSDAIFK
jgi:hypothetical protein